MRVTFRSGELDLEGDLTAPSACSTAAVICHPHPQYGGDMPLCLGGAGVPACGAPMCTLVDTVVLHMEAQLRYGCTDATHARLGLPTRLSRYV